MNNANSDPRISWATKSCILPCSDTLPKLPEIPFDITVYENIENSEHVGTFTKKLISLIKLVIRRQNGDSMNCYLKPAVPGTSLPNLYATGGSIKKGWVVTTPNTSINLLNQINNSTGVNPVAAFVLGEKVILRNCGEESNLVGKVTCAYMGLTTWIYDVYIESTNCFRYSLLEECLEKFVDDVWPPVCTCDTQKLCNYGCTCGAMEREKLGKPPETHYAYTLPFSKLP